MFVRGEIVGLHIFEGRNNLYKARYVFIHNIARLFVGWARKWFFSFYV